MTNPTPETFRDLADSLRAAVDRAAAERTEASRRDLMQLLAENQVTILAALERAAGGRRARS